MKIILADVKVEMVDAWKKHCGDLDVVSIHNGSIFDVDCDALVSPANSFGFMDGGLDLRISQFFGWHVQERLQMLIGTKHHGELLVGAAEIVPTDHARIRHVIAAPTMRVPMILGAQTVNVYLATRAVLLAIKHDSTDDLPATDWIQSVAIPGMGTGVGQVPFETCAQQMRQAIDDIVLEKYTFPKTWHEAQTRHQHLYTDTPTDLQY